MKTLTPLKIRFLIFGKVTDRTIEIAPLVLVELTSHNWKNQFCQLVFWGSQTAMGPIPLFDQA